MRKISSKVYIIKTRNLLSLSRDVEFCPMTLIYELDQGRVKLKHSAK